MRRKPLDDWREGESAPAQPAFAQTGNAQRCEHRWECNGRVWQCTLIQGHTANHVGVCNVIDLSESVPPAAPAAPAQPGAGYRISDEYGCNCGVGNCDPVAHAAGCPLKTRPPSVNPYRSAPPAAETARFDKLKAALSLIENYDSSCECDDHTNPECCANVPVSDCFCAHCIAGQALLMTREEKAAMFIKESGKAVHSSDCATSIAPAEEPGPCDCAETAMTAEQFASTELFRIEKDNLFCWKVYLCDSLIGAEHTELRARNRVQRLSHMIDKKLAAHVREAAQGEIERLRDAVSELNSFDAPKELIDARMARLAAERKLAELDKALRFVGMMLDVQCQEAGDIDGATIEEWLISCGFYAPTVVTKPCDESEESSCMCAEVGFPTTCNKLTEIARAALASLRAESKEG